MKSVKKRSAKKTAKVSRQAKTKKSTSKVKRLNRLMAKVKQAKVRDKVMFELQHYPQSEEFTSSAACAMMVLKQINPGFKLRKESEYEIWQDAVSGSVWHGSKYGIAYALAKRGARVGIISNTKDEGYDKKMAVYENVNIDTLVASYNEVKSKAAGFDVGEEFGAVSLQLIKKALSANCIPIVLIDANMINTYLESSPHWIVVKGYDSDAFYINDPYSDSTVTIEAEAFKGALGFENNLHMVFSDARSYNVTKPVKK